jgi:hypothetical protein
MTFEEWFEQEKQRFSTNTHGEFSYTSEDEDEFRRVWEAAQPKWKPIKDAPLNVRILAATKGDAPDICKLLFSPSGILVAHLDCGSQYNAKDMYEVYMELPKP